MENAKELQKLAQVFNTDNIITNDDIEQVLKGILVIMNSFKKDNQSLNKETKEIVENLFNKILNEHDKLKESVNRETSDTKDEVNEKLEKSIAQMKKMCEDLMLAKPKDGEKGEDADEEEIVEKVLAQIKLPETEILTGDDIANRLESLEGDARLDFKALKNVPESKQNIINGGGWRNLYQMHDVEISAPTDNQVLTYDGTTNTWKNENATGGAIAFTDLTDVPASYTGAGSKGVRVNAGETALEFYTVVDTDEKVKYAADDTSAGYLGAKTVAGTGITLSEGTGGDADKLKITNSAPDQTVAFTGGTNVTIGGTYPNFTITDNSQVSGSYQASDTQLTSLAGLSYAGNGGKFIRVNAGETDFELATVAGGTIDGSGTTNELTYWVDSDTLGALAVATYPSLTELSYVKGVTSAIQTQIGTKAAHATTMTIAGTANQITSSAGSQDLSANRTWTLSLPADVLIPAVLTVPNTGLHLLDSDASHDLIIKPGSNLTADKTLTITTGDADVNLNLTAVTDEYVLAYDAGTNTWRGVVASSGGQTLYECVVASSGGDYTTLGAALAAGKTRIFVRNGTYSETGENSIASNTIIVGESRDGVIIDVDGTTNDRILLGNGSAITKVQISNLTLKCTTPTDYIIDSGNVATSGAGDIIFQNVTFNGGGIQLGAGTTSTMSGNIILDNCHFMNFTSAGAGLYMRGTTGHINLLKVTNCTTDVSTSNPDLVEGPVNGAEVIKFVCTNNSVVISDSSSLTTSIQLNVSDSTSTAFVANNVVHGGGLWSDQGHPTFTGECVIMGNSVRNHSQGNGVGINGTPPNTHIINNEFNDCSTGIRLTVDSDNCVVTGNTLEGNTFGIKVDAAGATSNSIYGNFFRDNSTEMTDSGTTSYIANNFGELSAPFDRTIVYMTNTSGGTLNAGDVVILKSVAAGNEVTTTTTAGDNKVFGMVYDSSVLNNAKGKILTRGKTVSLKVNGTTDIAIGDYLTCFTTAKIAAKAVAGDMVFAMALEAYTTDDSNGVIDALLITPRLI